MIRLHADAQHAALAHGIAAARDVADLCGGEHQVLVAHDFRGGRGHFRNDCRAAVRAGRASVVASSRNSSRNSPTVRLWIAANASLVVGIEHQAAHFVGIGIDQRLLDDFGERQIGELALGGHAFALGARGDARQLVAGLLLVGLGEQLAQVGEDEALVHAGLGASRCCATEESSINARARKAAG